MVNLRGWWRKLVAALTRRIGAERSRSPVRPGGGTFAPGARELIAALSHPNPDVRAGAALQLARFADESGKYPSEGDRRENIRREGASVIVGALIDALADDDPSVRSAAALSLGEWGAAAAGAIPVLIEALAEEDDDVRSSAGIALQDIGTASRRPLQQALAHPDARVRAEAEAILDFMPED